eukprot:TRINITY_DN5684_c0_g1_i1.p2 TRINITY_DN5684_c0_g1~~TRINITY_DN5684_c0_g1_i1.p2  ORF type:complete len:108 (+),score=14.38 TRINITY_DN5684_c0_g1_i1:367-690(+)
MEWGSSIEFLDMDEADDEVPLPVTEEETRTELNKIHGLLCTVNSEWGLRVKAMLRMEEMVRFIKLPFNPSTGTDMKSWASEIRRLEEPFGTQITNFDPLLYVKCVAC